MEKNKHQLSRRDLLRTGALAGAGAFLAKAGIGKAVAALKPGTTPVIKRFVDPLLAAIPKLTPDTTTYPGKDFYTIYMAPGRFRFSSQLPVTAPAGVFTTLGYGSGPAFFGYLGPTIEATKGRPVVVKYINNLPPLHPLNLSIDPTVPDPLMYPGLQPGRVTPHLHGGFTNPDSDGHPHSWWNAGGAQGSHYRTLPGALPGEAIYEYSNDQPAAMLWYHDHAMGITRLNAYAGLAALYFVRDGSDTGLSSNPLGLPAGAYEIPLVIQDKSFNPDGSLFYPTVGITAVHPIWMPEFFGDTPVVNGTAYPFHNVEPRRYRFRMVNGSQARFYNLSFDNGAGPIPFHLIGMEQSLTPAAVPMTKLLLAPGERADVIIDFAGRMTQTITLRNNAKAPYPGGRGGEIPQIMQFRVNVPLAGSDTSTPAAALVLPAVTPLVATPTAPMREIVMKEDVDPVTGLPIDMRLNGKWFDEAGVPIDELPLVNDTEVWQFINLTVDAHPMHLHLVKFQVVNRQPFNAAAYTTAWTAWIGAGSPPATKPVLSAFFAGAAVPPAPEESGWKDTAKSYPGEILRVIAKFELPAGVTPPAEYVYHCHILEHEENEMMRPFLVTAPAAPKQQADRDAASGKPAEFALDQNYPNPFNPETTIRFHLAEDAHVRVQVFNSAGQRVATLVNSPYGAGSHAVTFNASNLPSGVYNYRIDAGSFRSMKRMVLVR